MSQENNDQGQAKIVSCVVVLTRRLRPTLLIASVAIGIVLNMGGQLQKPSTAAVRPVTDTYYGQSVVDPYRWLELGCNEGVEFRDFSATKVLQPIFRVLSAP